MSSEKRQTNNSQGAPTAILYIGIFACAGCLGLAVLLLVGSGFVWAWMRLCEETGLGAHFPSHGGRVALGTLLYLMIVVPLGVYIWKKPRPTEAEIAARRKAQDMSMPPETKPPDSTPPPEEKTGEEKTGVRFDGVYVCGPEISPHDYDYVTRKYLQRWDVFRFFHDGTVSSAYTAATFQEAFSQLGPENSAAVRGQYTCEGTFLTIRFTETECTGQIRDDALDLSYDDNSYMGYSTRLYTFIPTGDLPA